MQIFSSITPARRKQIVELVQVGLLLLRLPLIGIAVELLVAEHVLLLGYSILLVTIVETIVSVKMKADHPIWKFIHRIVERNSYSR